VHKELMRPWTSRRTARENEIEPLHIKALAVNDKKYGRSLATKLFMDIENWLSENDYLAYIRSSFLQDKALIHSMTKCCPRTPDNLIQETKAK
jgi:hypothetical protein